jgi:hypothetical protein
LDVGLAARKILLPNFFFGMWVRIGAYRVFVERSDKNALLEKPYCRCKDNIKVDIQRVEREAWTGLLWLRMETGGGRL